jgi:hypothetical protein
VSKNPDKSYVAGHLYENTKSKIKTICENCPRCFTFSKIGCNGTSLNKRVCGWKYSCGSDHNKIYYEHSKQCPLCDVDERE